MKRQWSGTDAIKFHILSQTPNGKRTQLRQHKMSHVMRKPVYVICEQQKRICAVWSAPLLFAAKIVYLYLAIFWVLHGRKPQRQVFSWWGSSGSKDSWCIREEIRSLIERPTSIWAALWQNQKMIVHPVKTQISLGIHPVWSESSLCAQWVAKDPSFLHADMLFRWTEAQADLRLCWAHMAVCWFCHEAAHFILLVTSSLPTKDTEPNITRQISMASWWYTMYLLHV